MIRGPYQERLRDSSFAMFLKHDTSVAKFWWNNGNPPSRKFFEPAAQHDVNPGAKTNDNIPRATGPYQMGDYPTSLPRLLALRGPTKDSLFSLMLGNEADGSGHSPKRRKDSGTYGLKSFFPSPISSVLKAAPSCA
ncbi:hypothetical protein CVT26_009244 [Gymnopilus dilepis]|uniref:Uncharacterized protein n=1 Tax=Gymnopilus dilepis TaxID=231916 RepID=A0A409YRN1_9AGAR|nr:hypothetical protein CVT26_009244 [Gymnopilus dilepis]